VANICQFTNNSGETVLVLNGMSDSSTSPKQGYEQTLTVLTFEGGGKTLESSKTTTLNLLDNQIISNLLISDPATLFPILAVGEGPDYSATGSWPKPNKPITVDQSDIEAIKQALQFCQNVMATPSSEMAVAFQAALTKAQAEGTADKILAAMTSFFQGYPSFSKVTYPAYNAVQTYLNTFALSWVQVKATSRNPTDTARLIDGFSKLVGDVPFLRDFVTQQVADPFAAYYIYSAPDADKKGAQSQGVIVATQKSGSSDNADPQDHLCGHTVELKSSSGSSVSLSYINGVFCDAEGGAVSLRATYSYRGRFTADISEVQLCPILIGTLSGKQVIGIPITPETTGDKAVDGLKSLAQSSFDKLLKEFMEGTGLWMAIDFVKSKLSVKKESLEKAKVENKGTDPTEEQKNQADKDADDAATEKAKELDQQGKRISGDDNFKTPTTDAEIATQVEQARTAKSAALTEVATENANRAIAETGKTLESIAEIQNTPAINEAGQALNDAGRALENGNIDEVHTHIESASSKLTEAVTELRGQISEQQQKAFNDEIEANKEIADEAREVAEESEKAKEGEASEGELDPLEEFGGIEA
jgi:hypothetical protein